MDIIPPSEGCVAGSIPAVETKQHNRAVPCSAVFLYLTGVFVIFRLLSVLSSTTKTLYIPFFIGVSFGVSGLDPNKQKGKYPNKEVERCQKSQRR